MMSEVCYAIVLKEETVIPNNRTECFSKTWISIKGQTEPIYHIFETKEQAQHELNEFSSYWKLRCEVVPIIIKRLDKNDKP